MAALEENGHSNLEAGEPEPTAAAEVKAPPTDAQKLMRACLAEAIGTAQRARDAEGRACQLAADDARWRIEHARSMKLDDAEASEKGDRMTDDDKRASAQLLEEGLKHGLGDASPTNKKRWS